MKLDILLVEVLLVAMVTLPYMTFAFLAFRAQKRLKSKFREELNKNNLVADYKGRWNKNMIAVDSEHSALLLVQQNAAQFEVVLIQLNKVIKVSTRITHKRVKVRGRHEEQLERVDLDFQLSTGDLQSVNLFDSNRSYQEDCEVKNAEDWCLLINKHIRSKPLLGAAA